MASNKASKKIFYTVINSAIPDSNLITTESCDLFYTTKEFIHHFLDYGQEIRAVTLPTNNNEYKCIYEPDKYRSKTNMLILGRRYSLLDPDIYYRLDMVNHDDLLDAWFDWLIQRKECRILKFLMKIEFLNLKIHSLINASCIVDDINFIKRMDYFELQLTGYDAYQWLMTSCMNGCINTFCWLITNCKKYLVSEDFTTAFYLSCAYNSSIMIILKLYKLGADVHYMNEASFEAICKNERFDLIKLFMHMDSDYTATINESNQVIGFYKGQRVN